MICYNWWKLTVFLLLWIKYLALKRKTLKIYIYTEFCKFLQAILVYMAISSIGFYYQYCVKFNDSTLSQPNGIGALNVYCIHVCMYYWQNSTPETTHLADSGHSRVNYLPNVIILHSSFTKEEVDKASIFNWFSNKVMGFWYKKKAIKKT